MENDDKTFAGVLDFLKETGQHIRHLASGEIIVGPSRKREADRARLLAAEQKRARKAEKLRKQT